MGKPYLKGIGGMVKNFFKIPTPISFGHIITRRCNYFCSFCNTHDDVLKDQKELTPEEIKGLIKHAWDLGAVSYTLTGGEPLVRRDSPEALKNAKSTGFFTTMVTNGFLVKQRIKEFGPHLDFGIVSLDFPDERHSTERGNPFAYAKAIEAIRTMIDFGITTHINTVVHKGNLDVIPTMVKVADKFGIGITFEPVYEVALKHKGEFDASFMQKYTNVIDRLVQMKKDGYHITNSFAYCELIKTRGSFKCHSEFQLRVDPYGYVLLPCMNWPKEVTKVGNIREKSLKEIWLSESAKTNREKALNCNGCYLSCYVEPSLILEGKMSLKDMMAYNSEASGR